MDLSGKPNVGLYGLVPGFSQLKDEMSPPKFTFNVEVTKKAREELVKKYGNQVIYSDTDSVFLKGAKMETKK